MRPIACLLVIGGLALVPPAQAGAAARPLDTALVASAPFYGDDGDVAFDRARGSGTSAIRLQLSWRDTAPEQAPPPAFDATNPFDGAYRWGDFDQLVRRAVAHGLEPFVGISESPSWAERGSGGRPGTNRPDPVELGRFAEAAARRYSGLFAGLPRVRTWEVWNEANASFFLYPQVEDGRSVSPGHYRRMVNAFSDAVRRVHPDNRVVAGGLFPFVIARAGAQSVGPLRFMRELFCLSKRLRPLPGKCGDPVRLDIWSHHPYTSGGPTHKAGNPDSVSIRELPRMAEVLRAAVRFKRVIHSSRVRFWVTEFSWDTNPPDPNGVPLALHARWVSEALYRMWRSGVSLVTWFQLRDDADAGRPHSRVFESGLYNRCGAGLDCDTPKPSLQAFRFPFVAFRSAKKVRIWGRTPPGLGGSVVVEQQTGRRWRTLASLRVAGGGIFARKLKARRRGALRARVAGDASIPFSLVRPPDRTVNPFG